VPLNGPPVAVGVVGSRSAAELVAGFLRSHGIAVAVVADDAGGQEPQLQLQGVRVLVDPDDEAVARRLIADVDGASGPVG
jgi:hypothetical protein